jgi:hypothetical protein
MAEPHAGHNRPKSAGFEFEIARTHYFIAGRTA